jgi:hypothetical protein
MIIKFVAFTIYAMIAGGLLGYFRRRFPDGNFKNYTQGYYYREREPNHLLSYLLSVFWPVAIPFYIGWELTTSSDKIIENVIGYKEDFSSKKVVRGELIHHRDEI